MREDKLDLRMTWASRAASFDACVEALFATFAILQDTHSSFANWETLRNEQQILDEKELIDSARDVSGNWDVVETTVDGVSSALMEGRSFSDNGTRAISCLGYRKLFCTLGDEPQWELTVTCANTSEAGVNSLWLSHKTGTTASDELVKQIPWKSLLPQLWRIWDADTGVLEMESTWSVGRLAIPMSVGWLTAFGSRVVGETDGSSLPDGVEVSKPAANMVLLTMWPQTFPQYRQKDLRRLKALKRALEPIVRYPNKINNGSNS